MRNFNKKTVAIVQARMNSNRLSNKMMLSLPGYPLVEWVFKQLSKSKMIDKIVFTIPDTSCLFVSSKKISVVRGEEDNLVSRYYKAAKLENATYRKGCADNPPFHLRVDRLVRYFCKNSFDYVYNHIPYMNDWPNGLEQKLFPLSARSNSLKKLSSSQRTV